MKICVIDFGLMVQVAIRLASDGHEVYLFDPAAANEFPSSIDVNVGAGFDGITVIRNNFWEIASECQMFVFADVNIGDLQRAVKDRIRIDPDWRDKKIYGLGEAEKLELDRWGTYKLLKSHGVPVPRTDRIIGIQRLREICRETDESFWIKTGYFRGDFETIRHENWPITELELDKLEAKLASPNNYPFLVVEHVEGVEIAYDNFQVDGKFPTDVSWGFENKALCYLAKTCKYDEMPKQILDLNAILSSGFAEVQARSQDNQELELRHFFLPNLSV